MMVKRKDRYWAHQMEKLNEEGWALQTELKWAIKWTLLMGLLMVLSKDRAMVTLTVDQTAYLMELETQAR